MADNKPLKACLDSVLLEYNIIFALYQRATLFPLAGWEITPISHLIKYLAILQNKSKTFAAAAADAKIIVDDN